MAAPIELDYAKLENDVKFVMSKAFEIDDLPRLRKFEDYLLAHRIPAEPDGLPDTLKFAKWDMRYRRILTAVRLIRQSCFALKASEEWLVYRIALLRYATHTLSFDRRRGRGECELPQLMHALHAVDTLTFALVSDDFHLRIRGERPVVYPPRQRISIDEAPWVLDCETYDPPYFVDPAVLANDRLVVADGWADPEDILALSVDSAPGRTTRMSRPAKRMDEEGRPLNPRGRTGIAGRGLLGLWGANLSVSAVCVRGDPEGGLEILLGTVEDTTDVALPKGFVLPDETAGAGFLRVLEDETGWRPAGEPTDIVFDGYTYDPRQTDHAWVETLAFLVLDKHEDFPGVFESPGQFDEVRWWPLDPDTVNRIPTGQARFVRDAIARLKESKYMDAPQADGLLAKTG
jgi:ADP-ribose pyrophosphatase